MTHSSIRFGMLYLLFISGCSLGVGTGVAGLNQPCTTDNDCDTAHTGLACELAISGDFAGMAICVPSCNGNTGVCGVYGLSCNTGPGLNGEAHENRCRQRCGANLSNCVTGMQCLSTGGNLGYCFPDGSGTCTSQCPAGTACKSSAQCASSLCLNGVCTGCTNNSQCGGNLVCRGGICTNTDYCTTYNHALCGNVCVDLSSDANNCSGCGIRCQAGSCVNSVCQNQCGGGLTLCGGACVNMTNDPNNCGGCGIRCGGFACINSACNGNGNPCPQGQMRLNDGSCVPVNQACKDGSGNPLPIILSCCDGKQNFNETCPDGGGTDCNSYYRCRFQGQGCKVNEDCNQNATGSYPNGLYCSANTCQPR